MTQLVEQKAQKLLGSLKSLAEVFSDSAFDECGFMEDCQYRPNTGAYRLYFSFWTKAVKPLHGFLNDNIDAGLLTGRTEYNVHHGNGSLSHFALFVRPENFQSFSDVLEQEIENVSQPPAEAIPA